MSYILEALTESEQARQQLAAVPKYSLLPVVGEEPPQQRRWPYALAGALLVNAAVLQLWLRPALPGSAATLEGPTTPQFAQTPAAAAEARIASFARSETPRADVAGAAPRDATPTQAQPERIRDQRAALPPAPADAYSRPVSANPANNGVPMQYPARSAPKAIAKRTSAAAATEAMPTPAPLATVAIPTPAPVAAVAKPTPAPVAAVAKPTPAPVAAVANPARTPTLAPSSTATPKQAGGAAELPPGLQQELPALSVAGFIRDEGSSSMVIVNDRLVREGDEVAPGVKLERIVNDSLEFTYKGYRFKR